MTTWSDRTTYQGKRVNQGTAQIMRAANKMVRTAHFGGETSDITMVQGGYNAGGVSASAGTHDGGGAFDLTPHNWRQRGKVFRILGVAAWHRPYLAHVWGEHIHAIVCGDGTASRGALAQVSAYYRGRSGLANNGADTDWRPTDLPILFRLDGDLRDRYARKACQLYDEPAATRQRQSVAVGDKITGVVAVVNVDGRYWFITADGKCGYEDNFAITPPDAAEPTPIPEPVPDPVPPVVTPPVPALTIWDNAHWNVASSKPGWFPIPWSKRGDTIGEVLAGLATSIVTVNETHFSYQTADILKHLGARYTHVSSPIGNDIFFDHTKWRQTRPYVEYDLRAQVRRAGVLHLTRIETGQPLTVVNTHFPYASPSLRTVAARNLVKLLKQVDAPIYLTGDFNNQSFADGTPHDLLRDAGYKFLRQQAKVVNGSKPEYPGKDQWLSDMATKTADIDLLSGVLTLTAPSLSDHRPIRARAQIDNN